MFMPSLAFAFQNSWFLTNLQAEIRPITIYKDQIVVAAKKNEKAISHVYLSGNEENLIKLELINSQPQIINDAALELEGSAYWLFKKPASKGSGQPFRFVMIGEKVNEIAKYYSTYYMGGAGSVPDCVSPPKDFLPTHISQNHLQKGGLDLYFVRVVSLIKTSTFNSMTKEDQMSGVTNRDSIFRIMQDGKCETLVESLSDADGLNPKGDKEPVGEVLGVLSLKSGPTNETWLVLRGIGYEISGITFIKIPASPSEKIVRHFVYDYAI